MPEWKYVLDQKALEFFISKRGAVRSQLTRAFLDLVSYPMQHGLWRGRDEFGRDVDIGLFGNFLIHYWVDLVVKEVRIVDIERAPRLN